MLGNFEYLNMSPISLSYMDKHGNDSVPGLYELFGFESYDYNFTHKIPFPLGVKPLEMGFCVLAGHHIFCGKCIMNMYSFIGSCQKNLYGITNIPY